MAPGSVIPMPFSIANHAAAFFTFSFIQQIEVGFIVSFVRIACAHIKKRQNIFQNFMEKYLDTDEECIIDDNDD